MKDVTIVGAGLVGSLWAVYMSKRGYNVKVFERRSDIRKADISAGKSINLALSDRGWKALDKVGVGDEIREIAIPMTGRVMHDLDGNLTYQPYGSEGQAIFSVSRGGINARLMDIAERAGKVNIAYNEQCIDVDLEAGITKFRNSETGVETEVKSDLIFACDGAFSAVRYNGFQKTDRFSYEQRYIEDGYREILLPANEDGSYKLDKNALHIWPRGRFMLIALANEDGSFTCTLFMPFEGENSFEELKSRDQVDAFFKSTFPDFYELMPEVGDAWEDHPLSSLAIVRCYPWTVGNAALMGDAAHATVPFYGQGMNCGFEDCSVLDSIIEEHGDDNWDVIFAEYQKARKPDGDAVQDLSLFNYHVMRDFVADPDFLLRKKIEKRIHERNPESWIPLYSQVTFSHIRYSDALKEGMAQSDIMDEVMKMPDIENIWDSDTVEDYILNAKQQST